MISSPRRTFWTRSPSPSSPRTPKRRPKEELLHLTPKKNKFIGWAPDVKQDPTVNLIEKFGLRKYLLFRQACDHVPLNFLGREKYIKNIISYVEQTLSEDDMMNIILDFTNIKDDLCIRGNDGFKTILWEVSFNHKESHVNFLVPNVDKCLNDGCDGALYPCSVAQVTIYKITGPEPGLKCCLRCRHCGTRYFLHHYSLPNTGRKFYEEKNRIMFHAASSVTLFCKDTYSFLVEAGNHAFVSHKAFAEIYNCVFHDEHPNSKLFHKWQCLFRNIVTDMNDEDEISEDCLEGNSEPDEFLVSGMTGKAAVKVFFNTELEFELQENNLLSSTIISKDHTVNKLFHELDELRRDQLYAHDCSAHCISKGCLNLRVIDGCWKLNMYHCMMAVPQTVEGYPLLNFPNVCTLEPKPGSVFCKQHYNLLQEHDIPTEKQGFLRYIGCKVTDSSQKVEEKVLALASSLCNNEDIQVGRSALEYQGTDGMANEVPPELWRSNSNEAKRCNKDIGLKAKLRQRSRGHFVCVTGGGHIMYFNPIFKSESPSQVFLQTVKVIYEDLRHIPTDVLDKHLENYFLSYDNMCHLDTLHAAQQELPLPEPFNTIWLKIKKVIDRLHLPNHKNKMCKVKYNPNVLPKGYNTQAAEQTFSWLGRFKKIVNSMTQMHHLFYLHRMIKRRNFYTAKCRRQGREPVLPQLCFAEPVDTD